MDRGNWEVIEAKLQSINEKIFQNYDVITLNDYEKRKIIYDYLCNTIEYDYHLLEQIRSHNEYQTPLVRNPYKEFDSVMTNQSGICNAIAQFYKMLLELNNIYSVCIICDDMTSVNHQLNLVYDTINDVYSFDDVTSVIVKRGTMDDFFDYDLSSAHKLRQGLRPVIDDQYWCILPTEYVYWLVGKESNEYLNYDLESRNEPVVSLPLNIKSVKQLEQKKI